MRKLTEAYLRAKAEELHVIILSVNFGPDHMHAFVGNCKNFSAATLVQRFKGFISFMMRKNHKNLFEHLLWGKKFWTSGYFYRSVGQATNEAIRYYIEHSQAKHWEVVDYEVVAARSEEQLTL